DTLRKHLHFYVPGVWSSSRGGYSWLITSTVPMIVRPIEDDNWEILRGETRVALIKPDDVRMFVFEETDLLQTLPQHLTKETAILLFAKRRIIIIEPDSHLYIPLNWT